MFWDMTEQKCGGVKSVNWIFNGNIVNINKRLTPRHSNDIVYKSVIMFLIYIE